MRVLIVLALLALALPCYAADTSNADWQTSDPLAKAILNGVAQHSHEYEKPETALGVGADVKLYDFSKNGVKVLESINAEVKYDINNEQFGAYGVVHLDLTDLY